MTDIMARIARNEPMTAHEQTMYGTVLNLCVDSPTIDGLFVLIEVIYRKATQRGITVGLNLRRPKRPKAERILIREFDSAVKALRPLEREMGFIEGALRKNLIVMSGPVRRVYAGARAELRRRGMKKPEDIDIMSEAIEAAAALGL